MEIVTAVALASIPVLFAAGYAMRNQRLRKEESDRLINEARERTEQRVRAKEVEVPDTDFGAIEFSNTKVVVLHDMHDGRGELSSEQQHAIDLIFKGYSFPTRQDPKKIRGDNPLTAAGIPLDQSVFATDNKVKPGEVEFLEPNFTWPERYVRD